MRSNDKQLARMNTMKDLDFTPDPRIVVAGADEVALMQDERRRSGKFIE